MTFNQLTVLYQHLKVGRIVGMKEFKEIHPFNPENERSHGLDLFNQVAQVATTSKLIMI
jgi:hypothetical protein